MPAAVGALAGFLYAKQTLSPEAIAHGPLPGLYTSAGAAFALFGYRVLMLFVTILRDVFGKKKLDERRDDAPE